MIAMNAIKIVNGPMRSIRFSYVLPRCVLDAFHEDLRAEHLVDANLRLRGDEIAFALDFVALAVDDRYACRPQLRLGNALAPGEVRKRRRCDVALGRRLVRGEREAPEESAFREPAQQE